METAAGPAKSTAVEAPPSRFLTKIPFKYGYFSHKFTLLSRQIF
jgi:hypothetical protein